MAGSRIKGITIELGGDTTGLDKALSGVNKNINKTKSELRDVEKLLKLDPTNTELLAQKQKLLSKAADETADKLIELQLAEQQVQKQFEEGKVSEEQYDALKREIIATRNELDNLDAQAQETGAEIAKISDKVLQVADSTQKMADKTKLLSGAALGVATGLAGLAVKSAQTADDINTLSKTTGLATDTIQKLQYASGFVDVGFDTVAGSLKKLTNNMQSAQSGTGAMADAFNTLGVSVTDGSGALRNNEEVFYEVIDALGNVANETERDALAMDIFGKSATDLNPLIASGADALRQLGDEAEASGLILSQDALDGANAFNDAIEKMKATFGGSMAKIGTELAEKLVPAMENLANVVGKVAGFIAGLDGDTLMFILTIVSLVAAISPVLSMISTIITLISTLTPIVTALNVVLAANPIGIVVIAIGALVAAFILLMKNLDKVKATFKVVFDAIWGVVKSIVNKITGGIENMVNNVINSINVLLSGISKIASAVGSVLGLNPINLQLSTVSLPKLANGGTFTNGSAIVGEAGAELLSLQNGRATVQPLNNGGNSNHTDITDLLKTYLPYLANDTQIVLDSGVLVGATAPMINNALGKIATRSGAR